MPYGKRRFKRKRTYRRKKTFSRRSNNNVAYTSQNKNSRLVLKSPTIMPDLYFVKLRYQETINLTTSGTGISGYAFSINSINDPNISGTGHQPMGHDQLAAMYERYTVLGVQYDIVVQNTSTTVPIKVVTLTADSAWTPSTMEDITEQPKASKSIIVAPLGSGKTQAKFKGYISTAAAAGVPKKVVSQDDTWSAQFNANPFHQAQMLIYHQALTGSGTTAATMVANLTYFVRCKDRKEMLTS